jgi:hypothetical protein
VSFVDTSIYYPVVIMSVDSEYALWKFGYTCPPCPTNSAWFENMHVYYHVGKHFLVGMVLAAVILARTGDDLILYSPHPFAAL